MAENDKKIKAIIKHYCDKNKILYIDDEGYYQEVYKNIWLASLHLEPVFIVGESGTGKEKLSYILAELTKLNNENINKGDIKTVLCTGLSEELAHSQIFGHIKGAFTGAYSKKSGCIDSNSSVIIFDEIGDLSLYVQGLLLRFIEYGEYSLLGEDKTRTLDNIKIIGVTNKNLLNLIGEGKGKDEDIKMRPDFYSRFYQTVKIRNPFEFLGKGDMTEKVRSFISSLVKFHGKNNAGNFIIESIYFAAGKEPINFRFFNKSLTKYTNFKRTATAADKAYSKLKLGKKRKYPEWKNINSNDEKLELIKQLKKAGNNLSETAGRLRTTKDNLFKFLKNNYDVKFSEIE